MGLETVALAGIVGLGALTATTQVMGGQAQAKSIKRQGEYNAQVYEQQASMVQEQKKLEEHQYNRQIARMRGAVISRTAGAGLEFSGSPLAILIDNETQMQLDKAIGQYNLDVQSQFSRQAGTFTRYEASEKAKLAKTAGYTNAFSTILGAATSAAILKTPKVGKL